MEPAPVPSQPEAPLASVIVLIASALFVGGAMYAALSYGALPALLAEAGANQVIWFCH